MTRRFWIIAIFTIRSVHPTLLDITPDKFSAILGDQQSVYGTFNQIVPMPDQGGSFVNEVYLIKTSVGEELVLKAENSNWKTRKTLNEVSAIRYIEKKTKISVPHIIKYGSDIDSSPLNIEYILMKRAKGRPLNLVIDEIYSNKENYLAILNDLADIIAELHSIKFKYIGNVEIKNDQLTIVSPIEFPTSLINYPCQKFSEYAYSWLLYYTDEIKRLKTTNHLNQKHFSKLIPHLEKILNSRNFSILDDPADQFVYCHQDFVMKNILVDNNHVSSVIDWEWSGPALPEFELQTGFDFLQNNSDKELFEKLMAERGFPHFFALPPPKRQLFYDLIGHLYALISCYEWLEGKLVHSAKFLAQKLEQRMVKKNKDLNIENFANEKMERLTEIIDDFEFLLDTTKEVRDQSLNSRIAHQQPIAFFGLSGVGKTSLAHGLVDLDPDQFSLAPITTSRLPRDDDDLHYMEFLSREDFISNQDQGCFAISWHQDGNYYGYRYTHLENTSKIPILTCSLSAVQILKEYGAITILIKGDSFKGLEARGSNEITKNRTILNKNNTEKYLNQTWFKENIDIEHEQIWGDISFSIQKLYRSIIERMEQKN